MKIISGAVGALALTVCAATASTLHASPAARLPLSPNSAGSVTLQTLDVPIKQFPAATSTYLTGIRNYLISGLYTKKNGATVAVTYDRRSGIWSPLQYPGAASTAAYGPGVVSSSAFRAVGSYKLQGASNDHGFLYDSATNTYVTMDVPGGFCGSIPCNYTIAHSIYGKKNYMFVGNCDAVTGKGSEDWNKYPATGHAFVYDSQSAAFTEIDMPNALSTTAYGIWMDGTTVAIAGGFTDASGTHGYVRNYGTSQTLVYNYPDAAFTHFEGITGAGGAGNYNVIGDYGSARNKSAGGFFLPIRNWTAGTPTVIGKLSANSVYKNTVVGVYFGTGLVNGYVAQIP